MQKMIGLSRAIKLEWLNKAADLVVAGKNEAEIKAELNEYLAFEISSATNLRKTREILMTAWVRTQGERHKKLQAKAIKAYKNGGDKLAIHWAMLLIAYPIFADMGAIIGKLIYIQDSFTTTWLKKKLFEEWGERTTLTHSSDKILQTLKNIGAVKNIKIGSYKVERKQINDAQVIDVLITAALALNGRSYYELSELSQKPQFFPFEFTVTHQILHDAGDYTLGNYGGKVVVMVEE